MLPLKPRNVLHSKSLGVYTNGSRISSFDISYQKSKSQLPPSLELIQASFYLPQSLDVLSHFQHLRSYI